MKKTYYKLCECGGSYVTPCKHKKDVMVGSAGCVHACEEFTEEEENKYVICKKDQPEEVEKSCGGCADRDHVIECHEEMLVRLRNEIKNYRGMNKELRAEGKGICTSCANNISNKCTKAMDCKKYTHYVERGCGNCGLQEGTFLTCKLCEGEGKCYWRPKREKQRQGQAVETTFTVTGKDHKGRPVSETITREETLMKKEYEIVKPFTLADIICAADDPNCPELWRYIEKLIKMWTDEGITCRATVLNRKMGKPELNNKAIFQTIMFEKHKEIRAFLLEKGFIREKRLTVCDFKECPAYNIVAPNYCLMLTPIKKDLRGRCIHLRNRRDK